MTNASITGARAATAVAAAALAAALLSGCADGRHTARAAGEAPPAVHLAAGDVAIAARATLVSGLPVSGTLRPAVEVRVTAPVGEVIESVPVREGQPVRRGDVLARFRLDSLEPAAASAAAALRVAAADHERFRNLFAEGAVSRREVDAAEAQWRAAEAAEVQARKRLEDAVVRTPVSGVVSSRVVQGGDRVGDGDPMFVVVDVSELEFEATVPSEHVGAIRVGAPVRLDVTGVAEGIEGRVARVNAAADLATRQVRVYVLVPNRGRRLVGGLFASGAIVLGEATAAVAVPAAAVRGGDGGSHVLAVRAGRVERRAVTTGIRDDAADRIEIAGGLAEGDTVLVATDDALAPGTVVEIGKPR
jgi:RND family efflux transporter MFP subunit